MIVAIEGTLEKATPLSATINANGLSYLVNIPVTTASKLGSEGSKARLHTHAVYREDSQALYGFSTEDERDFFALMIEKVSGVGPKVALSMMSKLSLESLVDAISREDVALLSKTPGIGKKTAERVIIELKDKLLAFASAGNTTNSDIPASSGNRLSENAKEAVLALEALGYKNADATKAITNVLDTIGASDLSTEELIKRAFG